jgi:hypothetical protein
MKHLTMISILLSGLCMLSSNAFAEVNHNTTAAATVTASATDPSSYKTVNDATGTQADKPSSNTSVKKKHESICWTCHYQKQPKQAS